MKSYPIVQLSFLAAVGFGLSGAACSSSPASSGPGGDNGGSGNTGNTANNGGSGNTANNGGSGNTGGSGPATYTAKDIAANRGTSDQCPGSQPITLPTDITVSACTLPSCGKAACISTAQIQQFAPSISQDTLNLQAYCPGTKDYCVPGDFIATGGKFLFKKCTAKFPGLPDLEGRCISKCIPEIYNQSNYLQKDICDDAELCAPCYDPRLPPGSDATDACKQSCDTLPAPPSTPIKFAQCAEGAGLCVPSSLVPKEYQYVVPKADCTQDGFVCAPTEKAKNIHFDFPQCTPTNPTVMQAAKDGPNGQKGGCVPHYLIDDYNVPGVASIPKGFVLQDGCAEGTLCAPCNNPLTPDDQPDKAFTGACHDDALAASTMSIGGK